ncbi:MAG: DUF4249 family protein [Flavobacteriaceae bacterium]|nr:DUF4249 family protein [Flavobacteriaceae bacterium]
MDYIKILRVSYFIIIGLVINGCVEPITIDISVFEDSLVIEATITNEYKFQQVKLTRSFKFEDELPTFEINASVKIVDDVNNTFLFQEKSAGTYISIEEFKAQPNTSYQLLITTNDDKSYSSQPTQLPKSTQIDNLYAIRETDDLGNEGVLILVDSYDASGDSKYYRYEFEETYKIVAPKWVFRDMVINPITFQISFEQKTKEEKICYNTILSNTIIQTETTDLSEDRVTRFNVRTIPRDNPIISHRYSILVKQYVQNLEAYTYFKTLNKLSGSESLLSQNQPGFFNGNVFSKDNQSEKVLGYFEVTTVSSKRIYFNYLDLFPNELLPPYFEDCEEFAPEIVPIPGEPSSVAEFILAGTAKYYRLNTEPKLGEGPYRLVRRACGDCTVLGTNIKPGFWEE